MNSIKCILIVFTSFIFLVGCKDDDTTDPNGNNNGGTNNIETIDYEESFEDFPNPERGFYKYSETSASNYNALNSSQLIARRGLTGGSGASYQTHNTLVFRYFILDSYVNSAIDADFLTKVQNDFDAARNGGVKMIPRFCYTTFAQSGSCPEDFICPPYGDASKDIVLNHINQLAPIINQNADVILCMQMGFIGTWGENYYTDFFGDASSNGTVQKLLDENWEDRIEVLQAMLDNFDNEIMIQVRYPQMKQRTIYGINALTNVAALTNSEAFTGSDKARIGLHNDCLFANFNDFGTYEDYGNSSSGRSADVANLKPYLKEDARFVYVGGETCFDGYNPQSNCSPEGLADTELRDLHYTYLNADYNNEVNNDWVDGGCMDAIKLNIGYRYVLRTGKFEKELSDDKIFDVELDLENVGYATVLKDRPVYLILKSTISGEEYRYTLDSDMRRWESTVNIKAKFTIDNNTPTGEYDMYLFLPDNHSSIADRPEYSIRLGNTTRWDETTGYNDLGFQLKI